MGDGNKSNKGRLLEVRGLRTYFYNNDNVVKAVDGVSFNIKKGETLGIVGESGCGKSVTSLSIMQLVPRPKGNIVGGDICYTDKMGNTVDLAELAPHGKKIRKIRGREIAMIFQEPMVSLNPVYTIGRQIVEAIRMHYSISKKEAKSRAVEMLDRVGIAAPHQRVDEYPHELSGGMRQRAMIAMALSCNPSLLIADEPTTALDVTIEAQILELMQDLQEEFGMSIMLITHDLGVIGEISDRVIVMYLGKVVETGDLDTILDNPKHPYTKGLMKSIPEIGCSNRLTPIEGSVPDMHNLPQGCYFAPRCPKAMDICRKKVPDTIGLEAGHTVKCWLFKE